MTYCHTWSLLGSPCTPKRQGTGNFQLIPSTPCSIPNLQRIPATPSRILTPPTGMRALLCVPSLLSAVNWWTQLGRSSPHSEQIVHFRDSHKNQRLKRVINVLGSPPWEGECWSLYLFLFPCSWRALLFHNAGGAPLFAQNSPVLPTAI